MIALSRSAQARVASSFPAYDPKPPHVAKGTLFADTHAAWRTWVGNYAKFKPGGNGREDQGIVAAARRALAADGAGDIDVGEGRPLARGDARRL